MINICSEIYWERTQAVQTAYISYNRTSVYRLNYDNFSEKKINYLVFLDDTLGSFMKNNDELIHVKMTSNIFSSSRMNNFYSPNTV